MTEIFSGQNTQREVLDLVVAVDDGVPDQRRHDNDDEGDGE